MDAAAAVAMTLKNGKLMSKCVKEWLHQVGGWVGLLRGRTVQVEYSRGEGWVIVGALGEAGGGCGATGSSPGHRNGGARGEVAKDI